METLNTEAERLKWRRNKVLELTSEGRSQPQIASTLQVGLGTVNRDIQHLKRLAQANISKYINETLPLEYQSCLIGLNAILTKTWDITNNSNTSERDRLQSISISMQAYNMKLELLSSATVVERAVNFVNRHRGLTQQTKELVIDNNGPAEPIANP